MAFEGLTEKISATFKKLRGKGRIKESDVKEAMREIRMALFVPLVQFPVTSSIIEPDLMGDTKNRQLSKLSVFILMS